MGWVDMKKETAKKRTKNLLRSNDKFMCAWLAYNRTERKYKFVDLLAYIFFSRFDLNDQKFIAEIKRNNELSAIFMAFSKRAVSIGLALANSSR